MGLKDTAERRTEWGVRHRVTGEITECATEAEAKALAAERGQEVVSRAVYVVPEGAGAVKW